MACGPLFERVRVCCAAVDPQLVNPKFRLALSTETAFVPVPVRPTFTGRGAQSTVPPGTLTVIVSEYGCSAVGANDSVGETLCAAEMGNDAGFNEKTLAPFPRVTV